MKDYDGKVRLVFRNFPLDMHPLAGKAAEAGACAADQNKFWQMHDRMFGDQNKLTVADLKKTAREIGIDGDRFDKCLDGGEKRQLVDADLKAGTDAGVSGTPAFFVNGVFINGSVPYEDFKQVLDRELDAKAKG
jgi:protein-disulfide isomerase